MKKNDIPYGVGVLVAKDGKFLCGLRKDTGEICGPGGHLEKDESPEQAAVRETREEFGITPTKLRRIGCLKSKTKAYLPTMVFLCTEFEGEPKMDSDEMVSPYYGFNDIADLERKDAKLYPAFEDSLSLLEDCINGRDDGGPGSGFFGHEGRPGQRGGSSGGSGKNSSWKANYIHTNKNEKGNKTSSKQKKGNIVWSGVKQHAVIGGNEDKIQQEIWNKQNNKGKTEYRFNKSFPEYSFVRKKASFDGGPGSGNWGHVGRPGLRGGSGSGGGASAAGSGSAANVKVKSYKDLKMGDSIKVRDKSFDGISTLSAKVVKVADDHAIAETDDGIRLWIDNDTFKSTMTITKRGEAKTGSDNSARVARMVKNMSPEERKLYDQAHADSEKAVKMMNDTFQSNMDTWSNASEAVKAGRNPITATAAAKNHTIPGASSEAQKAYDDIRSKEPQISKDMVDVANNSGSAMYGLDYSCKTGSSVANKIERKQEKNPSLTDTEIVQSMGDAVRYTQLTDHDKIASTTKKTIKDLQAKGYTVNEVDNKYQDATSDYKGVHIGAVSPSGQQIELQIHSKESMKVKETIHPMYDIARDAKTPQRVKKALQMEMHDISSKMATPKGVMESSMKSWKK